MFDALEPRRLFASVTLIAHGLEPFGSFPSWPVTMANDIAKAEGGADVYRLTVNGTGANAHVVSFKPVKADKTTPNGNAIVELDWAQPSQDFSGGSSQTTTARMAALIAPYFLNSQTTLGPRTQPLAELPIHLIGHSRGASLVDQLAFALGAQGVWVDQVTTLDARPVGSDPNVISLTTQTPSNVLFADGYYERNAVLGTAQAGQGAVNINLSDVLPDASGVLDDVPHNDVFAYYDGTINPSATSIGGLKISPSWYATSSTGPRTSVGWAYAVGAKPSDGDRFSGADRTGTTVTATGSARWDDPYFYSDYTPQTVNVGAILPVTLKLTDFNGDSTFKLFFDADDNPYNGTGVDTGLSFQQASTSTMTWTTSVSTASLPTGVYHLVAVAQNPEHVRYNYALGAVTVLPEGVSTSSALTPFSATSPISYTDAAGNKETLKLSGPGTGFLLQDTTGNASLISVSATTTSSSLTLSGKPTTLASLTVAGDIKSVSATTATLTGTATFTGSLATLSLAAINGGTLAIASGNTPVKSITVKGAVANASINSSRTITTFSSAAFQSSHLSLGTVTDGLTLNTFKNAGLFSQSSITVAILGSAKLGTLLGATGDFVTAHTVKSLTAKSTGKGVKLSNLAAAGTQTPDPALTVTIA